MSTISIIGAGGMAAAIAGLAAKSGHRVEVMSRDAAKARALAGQISAGATAGKFGVAPVGEMVILAVPYAAVLDVVKQYGDMLARNLLVDLTNPVAADLTRFVPPGDSFGAQEIARVAPLRRGDRQSIQHPVLTRPGCRPIPGAPARHLIAGDDAGAKARVALFIESLGLRPMDIGLLPMARTLGHVCLLSLGLLAHTNKQTNFSIGGQPSRRSPTVAPFFDLTYKE